MFDLVKWTHKFLWNSNRWILFHMKWTNILVKFLRYRFCTWKWQIKDVPNRYIVPYSIYYNFLVDFLLGEALWKIGNIMLNYQKTWELFDIHQKNKTCLLICTIMWGFQYFWISKTRFFLIFIHSFIFNTFTTNIQIS